MELGRLEKVDLRGPWPGEATHFTPWLASEDNLALLADTLQLDLELVGQEQNVGPFRADILCRETITGDHVLIENQLERTDHAHLGQLITYAAGLHAATIVWIAARVTEEHRAALDWMNEITTESFRFFALEVELWRIGDSLAAPKFNIVSQPNNWSRRTAAATSTTANASPLNQLYERYWTALLSGMGNGVVRPGAPQAQNWLTFAVGRSSFHLSANVNSVQKWIRAELFIQGTSAKRWFEQLRSNRDEIEAEFGEPLDWQELPERVGCRVCVVLNGADVSNEEDWGRQHDWLIDRLDRLHGVFYSRVRELPKINDLAVDGIH